MTETLYRHFAADALLYVGVTNNMRARQLQHAKNAEWWPQITRITEETYDDRWAVLAAERRAISTERPQFNKAGGPPPYPGSVIPPRPAGARVVLVTGSREFSDREMVAEALAHEALVDPSARVVVVHGAAAGADALAHEWVAAWRMYDYHVEPHPARWRAEGNAAGSIRNQRMVNLGADVCLAFFKTGAKNIGTSDCVAKARAAGIPVKTFWQA